MRKGWRKTVGRTGAVLVLAAALTGCGGDSGESEQAVSAVADGVLTVGILDGQDAYAKKAEGEFVGIEPEIMALLGETLGIQVEYREAQSSQELMDLLDSGAVDLAAGRLTTASLYADGRLQSRNYAKRGLYLAVRKGSYVDTLAGYSGESVAVSRQIPATTLLDVPYLDQVEQVAAGDLAGIGGDIDKGVLQAAILTEREALDLLSGGLVQVAEIRRGPKMEAVFCLSEGQAELTALVNDAINTFLDTKAGEE